MSTCVSWNISQFFKIFTCQSTGSEILISWIESVDGFASNKTKFCTEWFYSVLLSTVAHNCHIKTKCSHQIQIAHSKFKSLTANSNRSQQITNHSQQITNHSQQITNRSQQIQIAHSKFKSLTANYKSLTANYNSLTANSNRPQQIQIVHSKLKSALTANSNCSEQISNYYSARRLWLSTASGATRLKIFVIHEAA